MHSAVNRRIVIFQSHKNSQKINTAFGNYIRYLLKHISFFANYKRNECLIQLIKY